MSDHDVQALVATVINDGDTYKKRCEIARKSNVRVIATEMTGITVAAVYKLERQFGDRFDAVTILRAAAEVAEYMLRHVAEVERHSKETFVALRQGQQTDS